MQPPPCGREQAIQSKKSVLITGMSCLIGGEHHFSKLKIIAHLLFFVKNERMDCTVNAGSDCGKLND